MSICTDTYLKSRFQTACIPTQQDFEDFIDSAGGVWQGKDASKNIRPKNDGAVAGNTRGACSVDLQTSRDNAASVATGESSFIGSGHDNRVDSIHSVVVGGGKNKIYGTILDSVSSAILGGNCNSITCTPYAAIGGGCYNRIDGIPLHGDNSAIAGGANNYISSINRSFIGGGESNLIVGTAGHGCNSSIVGGGGNCICRTPYAFIGGGYSNTIITFAAPSTYSLIVGGNANYIQDSPQSFIGGGGSNCILHGCNSFVGGGTENSAIFSDNVAIVSGKCNFMNVGAVDSFIGAGNSNSITSGCSVIGSGCLNVINGNFSGIMSGNLNTVSSDNSAIVGSQNLICNVSGSSDGNFVLGNYNKICHGSNNFAIGCWHCIGNGPTDVWGSVAIGGSACIDHSNAIVVADGTFQVPSIGSQQFLIATACGGTIFSEATMTNGVVLAQGATSWAAGSDINVKENIHPVNYNDILNKIEALPITTWNLKAQPEEIKHIGPMAQDFKCIFGLGSSEKHIETLDADGILFAGLKGLKQQLDELAKEVKELRDKLT